ncbi:hypothetical protein MKX03_014202 [Papaver bracteatum]|nr:hypothetical protein MKX03_014202 [Papaver bracteatum]
MHFSRALGMIRCHVLSIPKSASSQVHAAIRGSGGSKASESEGVETSVICFKEQLESCSVHQRNSDFAKKEELPSLTRSGCAYLVQVCLHEHPLIFSHLPPRTVKFASIDRSSVHLFRILADVHERLTFRAGTHIWDEIANYIPFDDDLNYPAKLECSAETEPVTTSVKC